MSLPEKEILWVTYLKNETPIFYVTSDEKRTIYKLYNENFKLIKTSKIPTELEKIIYPTEIEVLKGRLF